MELGINNQARKPLKIGIIGAGFSGTALAANLFRKANTPLEITLIDKTGEFGAGEAYRTPFSYHLLNVRAKEMSAFPDDSQHFVNWLRTQLNTSAGIGEEFVSRPQYRQYLENMLHEIQAAQQGQVKLTLKAAEAIDLYTANHQAVVALNDGESMPFDKVVLAIGNGTATDFPFPVASGVSCANAWQYTSLYQIPAEDPVLIVGTGLSMIDAVLTLHHQQHRGQIYAVSRHGLLPLPHAAGAVPVVALDNVAPDCARKLTKQVRTSGVAANGDWRSVINAVRNMLPAVWKQADDKQKKRFLRHVMPYWNIHRHRVQKSHTELLESLEETGQLTLIAGRILSIDQHAIVKQRSTGDILKLKMKWLINCIGPTPLPSRQCALIQSLSNRKLISFDTLGLGFAVDTTGAIKEPSGNHSNFLYSLGPPVKGEHWECTAVPEIRQQCFALAEHLLAD